jgi:hypothetical protein
VSTDDEDRLQPARFEVKGKIGNMGKIGNRARSACRIGILFECSAPDIGTART